MIVGLLAAGLVVVTYTPPSSITYIFVPSGENTAACVSAHSGLLKVFHVTPPSSDWCISTPPVYRVLGDPGTLTIQSR